MCMGKSLCAAALSCLIAPVSMHGPSEWALRAIVCFYMLVVC